MEALKLAILAGVYTVITLSIIVVLAVNYICLKKEHHSCNSKIFSLESTVKHLKEEKEMLESNIIFYKNELEKTNNENKALADKVSELESLKDKKKENTPVTDANTTEIKKKKTSTTPTPECVPDALIKLKIIR